MLKPFIIRVYGIFINIIQNCETINFSYSLCHNNCVGVHRSDVLSTAEAITMILDNLEKETQSINNKRMDGVNCNVLLITKVNNDSERLDFRRDGCGVWLQKNSKCALSVNSSCRKVVEGNGDMNLWRNTFTCKGCPSLKKTEIYMKKADTGEYY